MRPIVTVNLPAWEGLAGDVKASAAKHLTAAMRTEARTLEKAVEQATVTAGLPQLAKTWQSAVYPQGRDVMGPAIWVWSKAPVPMRAFIFGAEVRPKGGRFLAIPTQWNEPRGRRGTGGRKGMKVTPEQMAAARGETFVIESKGKPGVWLWCVKVRPTNGRGARRRQLSGAGATFNTGHRAASVLEAQFRGAADRGFIPLFVLVKEVTLRKRIELAPAVAAASARIKVALAAAIQRAVADVRQAPTRAAA